MAAAGTADCTVMATDTVEMAVTEKMVEMVETAAAAMVAAVAVSDK